MPIGVTGRNFTLQDDAPAIPASHRFHLQVVGGADVRVSEAEAKAIVDFLQWRLAEKPASNNGG